MPVNQKCLWCNEIKCNHCRCLSSDDKEEWTCITHEPGLQCPNNKAKGRYKCNSCTKRRGRSVKNKLKLLLANQLQHGHNVTTAFTAGIQPQQFVGCVSPLVGVYNGGNHTIAPMHSYPIPYYYILPNEKSNLGNIPHSMHGVTAPAAPLLPTSIAPHMINKNSEGPQSNAYTNMNYMKPPYMMNPYYPHGPSSAMPMYNLPGTPYHNLMPPYNNTMHPMQPSFVSNDIGEKDPRSAPLPVGEHNSSDSLNYTHPDTRALPNYNYGVINPIGSEGRASHGNTKGNAKSIDALSIATDQSISTAMPLHPIDTGNETKSSNDTLCRWCKKLIHTSNEMNEHDRELLRHQHESLCYLDNNSDIHGK